MFQTTDVEGEKKKERWIHTHTHTLLMASHTRLGPFNVDKAQSIGNANPKHMLVASYFKTFVVTASTVVVLFLFRFLSSGAHTHTPQINHRYCCCTETASMLAMA